MVTIIQFIGLIISEIFYKNPIEYVNSKRHVKIFNSLQMIK